MPGRLPVSPRRSRGACSAARRHRRRGRVPGGRGRARGRDSRSRRSSCRRASIRDRFRPLDPTTRRELPAPASASPRRRRSCSGVSRLVPRKGFDVLIDAVAGLPTRGAARDRWRRAATGARLDDTPGASAWRIARASSAACPTRRSPALYAQRGRVRDALPRPLGRARGRGVRRRVPRGGGVRRSRRSRAARGGSHEAVVDGETGFVVEPRNGTRCEPRSPGSSRRRHPWAGDGRRRAPGERVERELSYDRLVERLLPLTRGDFAVARRHGLARYARTPCGRAAPEGRRRVSRRRARELCNGAAPGRIAHHRRRLGGQRAVRRHRRPRRAGRRRPAGRRRSGCASACSRCRSSCGRGRS